MAGETVQYKRTVKGSVGAGMGALFNGSGRQFFILQHKDSSRYHQAGESQKIIIDQIELGRAKECQIRYDDETWPIVSRRHAAIEKDATGWKIVPLSQTNSTLVNGKVVNTAWYLQNGDEIQLSIGGPRLGFIVPAGNQSLVSSIKLTERLNLFREQALRPYKTAIGVLCSVLVLACCVGGYFIWDANDQLKAERIARQNLVADIAKQRETDSLARIKDQQKADSLQKVADNLLARMRNDELFKERIAAAKKDVFAVVTEVMIQLGDETYSMTSLGTGFLLSDGRFVTARHCVQPWMYDTGAGMRAYALSKMFEDVKITSTVTAYSTSEKFTFSSNDFVCDTSYDITFPFSLDIAGRTIQLEGHSASPLRNSEGQQLGSDKMYGSDWAYTTKTSRRGSLSYDSRLSSNMKAGQAVHVLGFPAGLGFGDGKTMVEPIYNQMYVSRDGLNDSRCIMVSEGVAHGNSGGPVFAYVNGQLSVVGIVSRKEIATQMVGTFGVQQQQQQYDQLVPMSNLK